MQQLLSGAGCRSPARRQIQWRQSHPSEMGPWAHFNTQLNVWPRFCEPVPIFSRGASASFDQWVGSIISSDRVFACFINPKMCFSSAWSNLAEAPLYWARYLRTDKSVHYFSGPLENKSPSYATDPHSFSIRKHFDILWCHVVLCPHPFKQISFPMYLYTEKTKGAFGGAEGAIWGFGSTQNKREPKYRQIQHNWQP